MRTWGFLAASILAISCGGGGGGGSPDAAPDDPDAEVPDAELLIDELSFYSVSVTVTGLAGTLVVDLNGTDELTFTADGSMTFGDFVADTEAYAVTVNFAPTSQTCAVTGGTGTIAGADVTATVTCASKAWSFPATGDAIAPFGGNEIYEPHVGIADSGDAVVAYYAYDSTTACGGDPCPLVFASERNGGVWTHPTSTTTPFSVAGYSTEQIDLAMADNGEVVVAYGTALGTPQYALFRSHRRNGTWTHPTGATDYYSFADSWAQTAIPSLNATGGGLLLWRQSDTTNGEQTYASEYTGGAWVGPTNLADNYGFDEYQTNGFAGGIADNGDLVVAWAQLDDSGGCGNPTTGCEQIYVSERRGGVETNPTGFTDHVSFAGTTAYAPVAAVNGPGEAIVLWNQLDGTTACPGDIACPRVYVASIAPGGRTLPTSLTDSLSFAGSEGNRAHVAIDDAGNVVVVWAQHDGTSYQLYLAERRGGIWTKPASLADPLSVAGANIGDVDVAIDNQGNAMVVWTQSDGTTACNGDPCERVYLAEYRGGAWTTPDDLVADAVSPAGAHASDVSIAMSDGGDAVMAWGGQNAAGTSYAIYIATYQ